MSNPRVFISHAHADAALARALVELMKEQYSVSVDDLCCTSVEPHGLHPGSRTSSQLRSALRNAQAVIGLMTQAGLQSSWVLFELGASWGLGKSTYPLLAGVPPEALPMLLRETQTLDLTSSTAVYKLVDHLESTLGERRSMVGGAVAERVASVVELASLSASSSELESRSSPGRSKVRDDGSLLEMLKDRLPNRSRFYTFAELESETSIAEEDWRRLGARAAQAVCRLGNETEDGIRLISQREYQRRHLKGLR